MPRFICINFYQNRSKIKLILPKKDKIFEGWTLSGYATARTVVLLYTVVFKNKKQQKVKNYYDCFFAIVRKNLKNIANNSDSIGSS